MEEKIQTLITTTDAFKQNAAEHSKDREKLLKEAREAAQREIRRQNDQFELEIQQLENEMNQQVAAETKKMALKTAATLTHLEAVYNARRSAAFQLFLEEVFPDGDRPND